MIFFFQRIKCNLELDSLNILMLTDQNRVKYKEVKDV